MNSPDEMIFDNLLDTSVDGNVFLEDLIVGPGSNVLEAAMKENMMEVWESNDYELLNSPLTDELKLDDVAQPTNYLEWINWDQKLAMKTDEDSGVPASSSSDSGLSSTDFNYEQQLSPLANEMDRSSTHTAGGSTCGSVDVDNISSPDTLCPSSPCSDIHMIEDVDIISSQPAPASNANASGPSLVLPVSLKDLNLREIKAVKIIRNGSTLVSGAASAVLGGIKSTSAHMPDAIKKLLGPTVQLAVGNSSQISGSSSNSSGSNKSSYPPIILSDEERRLLAKEGVELPSHYPLTKHEERELKRIRRKIRNKISAQDSRKRKRVYMDGLEDRVKQCADENISLQKRIRLLETENKSLVSQLKRLQSLLTGQQSSNNANPAPTPPAPPPAAATTPPGAPPGNNATAQPATCLLVLMLSFALFLLPNMRAGDSSKSLTDGRAGSAATQMAQSMMKMPPFAGRSRALLQDTFALESDGDMDLEMALGGEVVIGEDEEDEVIYVPMPNGPFLMGDQRMENPKMGQWGSGQKFGKQYPANPGKRMMPAFLAEHDYHLADPASAAKRARFRDELETTPSQPVAAAAIPAIYAGKEQQNQSKVFEELAELAGHQHHPSIVHVRISSEEL